MSVVGASGTVTTTYTKDDGTTTDKKPSDGNFTTTKFVILNGITWTAKIYDANGEQKTTGGSSSDNTISATTTTRVEITGTVAAGGFKYRYANTSNGQLDNNNQQLPSNIKTIKITLKKDGGGRRA